MAAVAGGLVPTTRIVTDPMMLYLAIGILGATVMPHNLYLHSAVVQTRAVAPDPASKRRSEEHTSELQSLMRISYAVFCLKINNVFLTHIHNIRQTTINTI